MPHSPTRKFLQKWWADAIWFKGFIAIHLLFRPGISHRLSTISFNNSDLSPTIDAFRVGISPRFSSAQWKPRILRPAHTGLESSASSTDSPASSLFIDLKELWLLVLAVPCMVLLEISSGLSEALLAAAGIFVGSLALLGSHRCWFSRDNFLGRGASKQAFT